MTPVLEVRALTRRFGEREIVKALDTTVAAGERLALRGSNGSGKTTLLRCITGAIHPSTGEVRVAGHVAGSPDARRATGATFSQERSFYLPLSGRDNLMFFSRLRIRGRRDAAAEVRQLQEELEIGDWLDQPVSRCSTGMTQQLGFARALLGSPALLLLDEPTRSLDDAAAGRMWAALDRRPDAAVVIATHRHEDIDHCSRTLALTG